MAVVVDVYELLAIEMAKEATSGTAVGTATAKWRGTGNYIEDQRLIKMVEELSGTFNNYLERAVLTKLLAGLTLNSTSLTAEQWQYLMVMGCGGPTSGSTDGAGSDKVFTTNFPTSSALTPVSYTMQSGANFEAYQMEYTVATKASVEIKVNDIAMMSGTLMGRQRAYKAGGVTGSVTVPTVSDFAADNTKVFLDAIGGVYGTTQVANSVQEVKLDFTFKWIPVFALTGQLTYIYPVFTDYEITGDIKFLLDAAGTLNTGGVQADWTASTPTPKLLRVDAVGPAVTTPGTTYSNKHVIFDLPIVWQKFAAPANDNGVATVTGSFVSKNSLVAGNAGKCIVVMDGVSTLP